MSSSSTEISWLQDNQDFPPPEMAMTSDSGMNGLVAAGGDLSVHRLLQAYSRGIFPWFSANQPILWWSPDPRMVLEVNSFRLHRSLRKTIKSFLQSTHHEIKFDSAFDQVIRRCAHTKRTHQQGTWIVDEMVAAYEELHAQGFAHSVETWENGQLVGGLYCVSIGHCVFGESMFSLQANASKIALAALVAFAKAQGMDWIDCQQNTKHLAFMGAREIARSQFLCDVRLAQMMPAAEWQYDRTNWREIMADWSSN